MWTGRLRGIETEEAEIDDDYKRKNILYVDSNETIRL